MVEWPCFLIEQEATLPDNSKKKDTADICPQRLCC